jgi:hypothetical protein
MSPEAIALRLEHLAQLYEMWQSLRHAKIIGPVTPPEGPEPSPDSSKPIA